MKIVAAVALVLVIAVSGAYAVDAKTGPRAEVMLENVAGWTAPPASSSLMHTDTGPVWVVTRVYREGGKRVEVTAVLGAQETGERSFDELAGQTREAVVRVERMHGLPVILTSVNQRSEGMVSVILGQYIPNAVIPGVLNFGYHAMGEAEALTFASKFDWHGFRRLAADDSLLFETF